MKIKPPLKFLLVSVLWLIFIASVFFLVNIFEIPINASPLAGISNLDRLFLKDGSVGTILKVNQISTGPIIQAQNSGTTVWSIDNNGIQTPVEQSETVTATWVISPTSNYVVMTSSAEFTSSATTAIITTTASAGQRLVLLNGNASDVLNLDGVGGTVECKADIEMGPGDTVELIFEVTDLVWYCLSVRDNS